MMVDRIRGSREERDEGGPPGFWLAQRLGAKVRGSREGGEQGPAARGRCADGPTHH